jgi:hypothetical protein
MRQTIKFASLRVQRMGVRHAPGVLIDWKSVPRWTTGGVAARDQRVA